MSNVKTLNNSSITPAIVLNAIGEDLPTIKALYAVAIKEDGQPICYATGDLSGLSLASLALHDLALKFLNGGIETEHTK